MNEYIKELITIAISVVLFLLGYRQTIGAKKERIRSANGEIERILVRRIVLDAYRPRVEYVGRLIDGKARDFQVRPTDLLSESQFLNNIFTRVVETDFIAREQREKILDRLSPVVKEAEKRPLIEDVVEELPSARRSRAIAGITIAIMAMLASFTSVFLTYLPEIHALEAGLSKILPMVAVPAAASLAIISFLIIMYRIREPQEEQSKLSALSNYVGFERDVIKTVEKAGFVARVAGPEERGYDFRIQHGDRQILVEIKAWKRRLPARTVRIVVDNLRDAVYRENATEGILVTRTDVRIPGVFRDGNRVKVMTLRKLRNYLVHATN